MSQISERNLDKLAKSYKVPYIIYFGDSPALGPQLIVYNKYQDQNPGKILVVYSNERAEQITGKCDTRIGTHETRWRYWPPSKGPVRYQETPPPSDSDSYTKGFLFGSITLRVDCGFRLNATQTNVQQKSFSSLEMKKQNHYFIVMIDSGETTPESIQIYFEISAFLIADYSKARMADNDNLSNQSCVSLESNITKWYEDNSNNLKSTGFDNPFGAFTNFTIQFPTS